MGFFDKVTEGLGTAAKKTEEMLQVTRLKGQASELNREKNQKLAEIGKRALELSETGAISDETIQKIAGDLKDIDVKIEAIEKEIEEVQAPNVTPPVA
jgi:uncharacterized coiled-coil DUF342 family protein